ncbi:MAG: hypothetical protein RSD82_06455, partial [Comamonas sp.]
AITARPMAIPRATAIPWMAKLMLDSSVVDGGALHRTRVPRLYACIRRFHKIDTQNMGAI